MDPATVEQFRRQFPVTERWAYLNHAAIAPLPVAAVERLCGLAHTVAETGDRRWPERNEEVGRVRRLAARLLGASAEHEVAFVQNTAEGLSAVAAGLDWRSGDNVVSARCEFPSNVYPWLGLSELGVELRRIPERNGRLDLDELLAQVDERTRVVALSWVQYASGFRSDLARIGAFCRERGILFAVDAIQGLGALTLDVERAQVDVCAAASHKWLLGPEGIAVLYVSDRVVERIRPRHAGWRSVAHWVEWERHQLDYARGALRFESGTLNVYGIHALGASLALLLAAGPEAVAARVLALAERVARGLGELGFDLASSRRPGETSGIVAAVHPRHSAGSLVRRLAAGGAVVAERGGRLRVAPHFYNTEDEVDRLLAILRDL